jgi:hypothetical protein
VFSAQARIESGRSTSQTRFNAKLNASRSLGMRRHSLWIVPLLLAIIVPQGQAGIFKRPNKPDPAEHVPALINTLKNDSDERKRANAAEELHEYDLRTYPDIMPALIEALRNDRSTSVRVEAVNSIRKSRPITQPASYAMHQAAKNDPSFQVRLKARDAIFVWNVLGLTSVQMPEKPATTQTEEPPLAVSPMQAQRGNNMIPPQPPTPTIDKETGPLPAPPLMPGPSTSRPRPLLQLIPIKNNKPKPADDGPSLNPPM